MAGLNRLTGTPWHVDRFARKEGDPRRHRSRCANYDPVEKSCCFRTRCIGSAHCDSYREESPDIVKEKNKRAAKARRYNKTKVFYDKKVQEKVTNIYYRPGDRVMHKKYGVGLVTESTLEKVSVRFYEDNTERTFVPEFCYKQGLLELM